MKKPDLDQLRRAKRQQLAQTRRFRRGRRKSVQRRRLSGPVPRVVSSSIEIQVPARLRYYVQTEQRQAIEIFLQAVDLHLRRGKTVILDFSAVEVLYPCGLLLLMGWVDEWVSSFPGKVGGTYPKVDLVEQMLQHVGVLKKLGLPERTIVTHNDVTRWHYFHGTNADATPIEPFMVELQALLGVEKQLGLGNCVTEAMINVGHHAYEDNKHGPWWIFATISNGLVYVALYDRGESVPATLLAKPKVMDFLTGRMWSLGRGDSHLITAALGGRTRTELPYRGKGLPEMLEFTKSYPNSELGIYSRSGFFRYGGRESSGKLKTPIKGTLVIWRLNIAVETND